MDDVQHLRRAFDLARPEHPHPNPRVGAVIVDNSGRVIGEGAHVRPGQDHAEIVALERAGAAARGATMYVSLEPCNHHGRTPPCVSAMVAAGLGRVVVGVEDPDPRVAGSGLAALREAGVEVTMSPLPDDARAVDPGYFRHRETGLPAVTLKYAMTLDGSVAAADGSSRWVSGEESRADAHELRSAMDAVVVGAGTLRGDDPLLDVRVGTGVRQPRPIVIAGKQPLPRDARIWGRDPLVIAPTDFEVPAGEVAVVPAVDGRPDPIEAARAIADHGYYDLLLEGGPVLAAAWWHADLIHRGVAYVAGKIGGGRGVPAFDGVFASIDDADDVRITDLRQLGNDVRIEFE